MALYWELWSIPTSNQIDAFASEAEALKLVQELLSLDWAADELVLLYDDPALPVEELPPALTGEALTRRVAAPPAQDARRTA